MTALSQKLKNKYYKTEDHPYMIFERVIEGILKPSDTLLDAGCGRTAPVLMLYKSKAKRLIGVDLVDFTTEPDGVELYKSNLENIPLESASVDVIMCRSVMEHVENPEAVYAEMFRILRPGGRFVFLTANNWDYATIIAKIVPNRFHAAIVAKTEGREMEDVFPTQYKTNSKTAVQRLAKTSGFVVSDFKYLSQYPNYFYFNAALFFVATGYEKLISYFSALSFLKGWILVKLEKPRS